MFRAPTAKFNMTSPNINAADNEQTYTIDTRNIDNNWFQRAGSIKWRRLR